MKASTHTLTLMASKDRTFEFLSRIENLPKWATLFCRKLEPVADGLYKVITPKGEIFFRIESDAQTGVIDMYGGPSESALAYWPTRVIPLGENESMFIFTALQYPGVSDSDFAAQCQGLEQDFRISKPMLNHLTHEKWALGPRPLHQLVPPRISGHIGSFNRPS
jgi:hypothetical protein